MNLTPWGTKLLIGGIVTSVLGLAFTVGVELVRKTGANAEGNAAIATQLTAIQSGVSHLSAELSGHAARIEKVEQGLAAAISARESIMVDYRRWQDEVMVQLREASGERKSMMREIAALASKVDDLRKGGR